MKIILAAFISACLLTITLSNYSLSADALKLAESRKDLTGADRMANALNEASGLAPAVTAKKLTPRDLSDINKFEHLKSIAGILLLITFLSFIFTSTLLIIKRKELRFDGTQTAALILLISWMMIYGIYHIFAFWEVQRIYQYTLFSGYGFNPSGAFAIAWIAKNVFTGTAFLLNSKNKSNTRYNRVKRLCINDLIWGNLIILFIHESVAGVHPIIDLPLPNWG